MRDAVFFLFAAEPLALSKGTGLSALSVEMQDNRVVKGLPWRPPVTSHLCHLPPVGPCTDYLMPLCLSVLICKIEMMLDDAT